MFTYLPQTMALFVLTPVVLETSKKWSPQGLTENQHHLWWYWNLSWTAAWYQNMFFHSFCFDPKTGRIWIFVPMVHTLFIRCKLEWSPTWIEGWHLAVTVECGVVHGQKKHVSQNISIGRCEFYEWEKVKSVRRCQ